MFCQEFLPRVFAESFCQEFWSVTKVRAMGRMRSFIMAIHESIHEGCLVEPQPSPLFFKKRRGIRSLMTLLFHSYYMPFHPKSGQPSPIFKFLTFYKNVHDNYETPSPSHSQKTSDSRGICPPTRTFEHN